MDTPAIAADGLYQVHVMWLDGISMDTHVPDPADKRYIENKRSSKVHSKGWERICSACIDAMVTMTTDGNYLKIPASEKAMIIQRQQGWMLSDKELGKLPNDDTPLVLPHRPLQLRPGQRKKNNPPPKAKHAPRKPNKPTTSKPAPRKRNKKNSSLRTPANTKPTHKDSLTSTDGASPPTNHPSHCQLPQVRAQAALLRVVHAPLRR